MPIAELYFHGEHPDYEQHDLEELKDDLESVFDGIMVPHNKRRLDARILQYGNKEEECVRVTLGRTPCSANLYPSHAEFSVAGEGVAELLEGTPSLLWGFVRTRYPEDRPRDWSKGDNVKSLFEYAPTGLGNYTDKPEYLEF